MFNSASLAAAINAAAQLASEAAAVSGVAAAPQLAAVTLIAGFVSGLASVAVEASGVLTSQDQAVVDAALAKIRAANDALSVKVDAELAGEKDQ